MTESERTALTMALDSGLPYTGLRDVAPDPSLLLYLPAALIRMADVVPLRLEDNMLRLACASPDVDLNTVRSRFPRLALEVSLAGVDEIRALRSALGEAAA
jgi:hypothetical protein